MQRQNEAKVTKSRSQQESDDKTTKKWSRRTEKVNISMVLKCN